MSQQARVNSIDAIRQVRAALIAFNERAQSALGEVNSEAQRAIMRLRLEAGPRWAKRLRERQDAWVAARSELIRKQASFSSDNPTCIEQRKAVEKAKASVEEAQQKIERIKRIITELERQYTLYKGHVAGLSEQVSRSLPMAVARLDRMTDALEAYRSVNPAGGGTVEDGSGNSGQSGEAGGSPA
jgi:DNA repair exonuclease SbcCD ATPase subunit